MLQQRKKQAAKIVAALKKLFPRANIALRFSNNWELLVAVILSAQCTDKKVNEVTARLFKKYRTLDNYARARPREFEKNIYSTGFYRAKTKNILAAAKMVKEKFGGKIPKTTEEILTIPGVARKTANVVLGNAYGVVDGIAVDTHVRRLSKLLGLTNHTDPVKIERDLMAILPKKEWFKFTYRLIEYGRKYCIARRHEHEKCPLTKILTLNPKNLKIKIQKILSSDGVGVLPTDTLYGLVGSALSRNAVLRIYKLKKRNSRKPLIILISSFRDLARFGVKPDAKTKKILQKAWPGKVSVILPCRNEKFRYLHRGTNTLAFRLPAEKHLRVLLSKTGPLVAPSVNPEGKPPARTIREAKKYFGDAVDFYVDGGALRSLPSTLIKIQNGHIVVRRRGVTKISH